MSKPKRTLIAYPSTTEQVYTLKTFMDAFKIPFEEATYNPDSEENRTSSVSGKGKPKTLRIDISIYYKDIPDDFPLAERIDDLSYEWCVDIDIETGIIKDGYDKYIEFYIDKTGKIKDWYQNPDFSEFRWHNKNTKKSPKNDDDKNIPEGYSQLQNFYLQKCAQLGQRKMNLVCKNQLKYKADFENRYMNLMMKIAFLTLQPTDNDDVACRVKDLLNSCEDWFDKIETANEDDVEEIEAKMIDFFSDAIDAIRELKI